MDDKILTAQVNEFTTALYDRLEEVANVCSEIADTHRHLPRKDYVDAVCSDSRLPPNGKGFLLKLQESEKDVLDLLIEQALKATANRKSLVLMKSMLGGLEFRE